MKALVMKPQLLWILHKRPQVRQILKIQLVNRNQLRIKQLLAPPHRIHSNQSLPILRMQQLRKHQMIQVRMIPLLSKSLQQLKLNQPRQFLTLPPRQKQRLMKLIPQPHPVMIPLRK